MIANEATFEATGTSEWGVEGTVEVTIRRETRRIGAMKMADGTILVRGLTGRYQQGGKAWPATVRVSRNNRDERVEFVWFGRDDRSGRFKKENGLSFA